MLVLCRKEKYLKKAPIFKSVAKVVHGHMKIGGVKEREPIKYVPNHITNGPFGNILASFICQLSILQNLNVFGGTRAVTKLKKSGAR